MVRANSSCPTVGVLSVLETSATSVSTIVRRRSCFSRLPSIFRLGEKLVAPLIAVLCVDRTDERHKKRRTQRLVSRCDTSRRCVLALEINVMLCAKTGGKTSYDYNKIVETPVICTTKWTKVLIQKLRSREKAKKGEI